MKFFRQLLRRPMKTTLGILLLTLAGILLCVSVGQFWAAAQTRRQLEELYYYGDSNRPLPTAGAYR